MKKIVLITLISIFMFCGCNLMLEEDPQKATSTTTSVSTQGSTIIETTVQTQTSKPILLSSTTSERGTKIETELMDGSLNVYLDFNNGLTDIDIQQNVYEIILNYSETKKTYETSDFLDITFLYKDNDVSVGMLYLNRESTSDEFSATLGIIWIDERYKEAFKGISSGASTYQETTPIEETPTTLVYEDEYVTISYSHIGEPDWMDRRGVVFTVENKTDYVLTFQADSLAINGIDLGNISMSDEISPQSTGEISAKSDKVTATTVSKISGQFRVIEWDNELFGALSYDAKFVNVEVS